MNPTIIKVNNIEFDIRNDTCFYVKIGSRTFYIEHNETAPMYVNSWIEGEPNTHYEANFRRVKDDI